MRTPRPRPEQPSQASGLRRSLVAEGVAQTLGEAVRSVLRVGSEIGHRIRHARCVRPDVVTPTRSGGRLRDRAAAFPRRLYATASRAALAPPPMTDENVRGRRADAG